MTFTMRQPKLRRGGRLLLAALLIGLLLGFLGPFGSYPAYSRTVRYAFWLGLTLAGVGSAAASDQLLSRRKIASGQLRIAVLALLSAIPMTFVVAWTLVLLQPGRGIGPTQLPLLFVAVAAVQLLLVYVTVVVVPGQNPAAPPAALTDPDAGQALSAPAPSQPGYPDALLSRIPAARDRTIFALETEDHYLRVHTDKGSTLVLMRMADAVAMLSPALGAQVHRRWWVASAAVADIRTSGGRTLLSLVDGRTIPVGRTFAAAARARFGKVRAGA